MTIDLIAGLALATLRTSARRSASAAAVTVQLLNTAKSASAGFDTISPPDATIIAVTASLSY
jgi:hypothetical protein